MLFLQQYQDVLTLSSANLEKISQFAILLKKYNNQVNLVSKNAINSLEINHILDSLMILKFVSFPENSLVGDMGSGGGFPGLILAMARPKVKFVLMECTQKKCVFLVLMARKFNLKNARIASLTCVANF